MQGWKDVEKSDYSYMLYCSVGREKLKPLANANSHKHSHKSDVLEIWMWNLYLWHGNPTESRGILMIILPSGPRT